MGKWNTLLDVANLALNIGQTAQLASQQEQLASMQEREIREEIRKKIIKIARDEVYANTKELKILTEYKEEAPLTVNVAARAMQYQLKDMHIDANLFDDIADKEYVDTLLAGLQATIDDSHSRLDPVQREKADAGYRAIIQMPYLEEAIQMQADLETYQRTASEWARLQEIKNKAVRSGWMYAIGALVLTGAWCGLGSAIGSLVVKILPDSEVTELLVQMCAMGPIFIVPLAGIVLAIINGSKGNTKEYRELRDSRQALEKRMASQDKLNKVYAAFGKQTSAGYKAMRDQRKALIDEIFADAEQFTIPADMQ